MSRKEVSSYVRDIIIYTHGLACFIASGLISTPKEEVIEMIKMLHTPCLVTDLRVEIK